jgi:hypothetical protein
MGTSQSKLSSLTFHRFGHI